MLRFSSKVGATSVGRTAAAVLTVRLAPLPRSPLVRGK
mgnify:CR=1 FL=1